MYRTLIRSGLFLWLLTVGATSVYAQDQAAERLYAEAKRLLENGDGDASLEELQLLVQQFPQDRLASKALLQIADIRQVLGDISGTRAALAKLRAEYGRSLESAAAFVKQAEIEVQEARRLADLEEARATFRRVPLLYGRETYPDLVDRVRARIRTGEISLRLGEDAMAVAEFLAAVEDEPPGRLTGRARLQLATALTRTGDWIAAAEVLQRLASEGTPKTGSAEERSPEPTTSSAADRASAVRLLSLIHRRIVRQSSGLAPWAATSRYPASGLQLKQPSGVAAAEDGRLVIVDPKLPLVALIDADGRVDRREAIPNAERPGWSVGSAFVAAEDRIVLPFDDQSTRFLEPRPGKENALKGLLAAERGPFGDWFLLAKGWKSLLSFESSRQGQELLSTSKPDLEDIAQDRLGRIYVLDRRAKQVLRLGVDRRQADTVLKGNWKRPVALTLDPLGNLYVLDQGNRVVEMYDSNGRKQAQAGPNLGSGIELRSPEDIAVDGTGRLFIADSKLPFIVMLD